MPRIPVAQLSINAVLRKQPFLLREKAISTTRSGADLMRLVLGDRTGSIAGIMFEASSHVYDSLTSGQGVEVTGRVEEFRNALQIRIDQIAPTKLDPLSEYLPASSRPLDEMQQELDGLLAGVRQPDLKRLLKAIFGDAATYKAFCQAPAAKTFHHACVGGLLEHTLGVARLVRTAQSLHPEMDYEMALTLALLHDVGKLRAYDPQSFALTEDGSLLGHLYISASMVEQAMSRLDGFDARLQQMVIHGLLAHHGRLEHGSPVAPMTVEAIVTHYADVLDATAKGAIEHLARADMETEAFTGWSEMHETRLYRGLFGSQV